MLSQRQMEIVLEYCNHPGEYYTASWFADHMGISLRTVQGDMKAIRQELENETSLELVSKTAKGSTVLVKDPDEFSAYVNTMFQTMTTVSLSYPVSRISQLLLLLLNSHRPVSFSDLEEKLFVSRSTLLNDLKKVEETLQTYDLELMRSANRIMIDGDEINKRRCLRAQNLYLAHVKNEQGMLYIDERQIAKIKNTLTEVFVEHKYYIADTDFNNLVLFLNVMIWRIGDGFTIQVGEVKSISQSGKDYRLAVDIFEKIGHRFFLRIPETEIWYLTIYLKGIGNNRDEDTIPPELNAYILETLCAIQENYGFDFTSNLNLRITLALHTLSLLIRLQYDMQVKNDMLDYIRETFPLGYDLAAFYAYRLKQKYGKRVTDDEIALLAIHFYSSLLEERNKKKKARVLVFTSLKSSMQLLLEQTLLRWFSEDIAKIDFINEKDFDPDRIDDYEIFLTTEKGEMFQNNLAMLVNPFPERRDYCNIKLNIDGFQNMEDVLEIFHPELFYHAAKTDRDTILKTLCDGAAELFELEDLHQQVFRREEIGSTYMTKRIAIAHPAVAVSSDTFIGAFVVQKPLVWDEDGNEVNLVLLMHIGKNNPQAFNLWRYIAKIFDDRTLVEHMVEQPSYENLINMVTESLRIGIDNNEF